MFSCRFCDLIFCLIDLNWKQLMEKKSERDAISGSFLSLRCGLPFPLWVRKGKVKPMPWLSLTAAEGGLGTLTGLQAWWPLPGCSVLVHLSEAHRSRKGEDTWVLESEAGFTGEGDGILTPGWQKDKSRTEFSRILSPLEVSASLFVPTVSLARHPFHPSPRGHLSGWWSQVGGPPHRDHRPQRKEKKEGMLLGQSSQRQTRTPQRVHTHSFGFHFFTEPSEDGWLTKDVLTDELPPQLCGSAGKESAYNAGDLGSIPGLGKSPGEGKGYPFQYSGLENSMEHTVHGVTKSRTWLSDFHSSVFRQAQSPPPGFETWQCFRDAMILAALGTPGLPDQTGPDWPLCWQQCLSRHDQGIRQHDAIGCLQQRPVLDTLYMF